MTSDKIKWIAAEWQSVTMEARARMRIQKTTLEYWALITEIAGAITIAVSVVYRGVQVHGSTKVLRSQAHYNALSLSSRTGL
jgi:hypothetical protein